MPEDVRDRCTHCGLCGAKCIAARVAGSSPTTILGGESQSGAWNCSNCWRCAETCPEGIEMGELITHMRRCEDAPPRLRRAYEQITRTGYMLSLEDLDMFREMWGMPKIRLADPQVIRKLLGS